MINCNEVKKLTDKKMLNAMRNVHDNLRHLCFERYYPFLIARNKWLAVSLNFRKTYWEV